MHSNGVVFLKVLLNKYALGGNEASLKLLPQEYAEALGKITIDSQDVPASVAWTHEVFSHVHYSWIAPIIKELPAPLQKVTLASLPTNSATKLKKMLGITTSVNIPSDRLKRFFLNKLYARWKPAEAIPPQYLPPNPLTPLLSLTKEKLVLLIDLLALNDLAEGIRHIVDKNTLATVYSGLSHTEQAYLRVCLHQRDKLKVTKLDITKLKHSPQELKRALHKRGMHRLGKALCGQSRQFLWHVTHILDTGRGAALEEHYVEQAVPSVTPMLVQQTQAAINFINES